MYFHRLGHITVTLCILLFELYVWEGECCNSTVNSSWFLCIVAHVCMYIHTYTYISTQHAHAYKHSHNIMCSYTHTPVYIHHIHTYTYLLTHACTCIQTITYVHIHTHTHLYIYTTDLAEWKWLPSKGGRATTTCTGRAAGLPSVLCPLCCFSSSTFSDCFILGRFSTIWKDCEFAVVSFQK